MRGSGWLKMIGGRRIVGCFVGVRETKEIIGRDENARDEMRKVAKRMSRRRVEKKREKRRKKKKIKGEETVNAGFSTSSRRRRICFLNFHASRLIRGQFHLDEIRIDRSTRKERKRGSEKRKKERKRIKKIDKGKNGKRKGPIGESIISTMPELREGRRRFSSQL